MPVRVSKTLNRTLAFSRGLLGSWLLYVTRYRSHGLKSRSQTCRGGPTEGSAVKTPAQPLTVALPPTFEKCDMNCTLQCHETKYVCSNNLAYKPARNCNTS